MTPLDLWKLYRQTLSHVPALGLTLRRNPAAMLALMWYYATGGKGQKDMVVLPYKDSLLLFSRYLQQLVMESLGKRLDLQGRRVDQGLSVYGNKGSGGPDCLKDRRSGVSRNYLPAPGTSRRRHAGPRRPC